MSTFQKNLRLAGFFVLVYILGHLHQCALRIDTDLNTPEDFIDYPVNEEAPNVFREK